MLPADYAFTAADNGRASFSVKLDTGGSQELTAADTVANTITGTLNVTFS